MLLTLNDRQQQLLRKLEAEGEVKVTELRDRIGVTEMTIRRDLEKLEQSGTVRRTFGGAIYLGKDIALQERNAVMTEQKLLIGKKAAGLVKPGESIFIDGGSTTLQVVKNLPEQLAVTAVTNALNVAQELMEKKISTVVVGGIIQNATSTLVGPIAVEILSGMAFDRVFLGATGLSARHGFSNSNMYESEIKRTAIRQASEVNIVVDRTKFGVKALASFAEFRQVSRVITDELPDGDILRSCNEAGVELMLSID